MCGWGSGRLGTGYQRPVLREEMVCRQGKGGKTTGTWRSSSSESSSGGQGIGGWCIGEELARCCDTGEDFPHQGSLGTGVHSP